jgi:hypothetical protein
MISPVSLGTIHPQSHSLQSKESFQRGSEPLLSDLNWGLISFSVEFSLQFQSLLPVSLIFQGKAIRSNDAEDETFKVKAELG